MDFPSPLTTPSLSISHLRKVYGTTVAVEDLSFEVKPREIVGLLGSNGAGKTTTINMILGVLMPSAGSIFIDGINLASQRSEALNRTNFAAVYAPMPGNLTVVQNLQIFGRLYGIANRDQKIETLLEQFDLRVFRNTKCGLLSSGEQTRVSLAKALLNQPQILLLDEPTASLDPASAQNLRQHIRNYASQGTGGVLWTSHNMQEVSEVCDRVLFLANHRIVIQGDPKTLPGEYGQATLDDLFIAVARDTARVVAS